MNFTLTYQSGQHYSERFSSFDAKVSRDASGLGRVRISFREKTDGNHGYASLSLPPKKAKQLAYAILMACAGDDANPIVFSVEAATNKVAA